MNIAGANPYITVLEPQISTNYNDSDFEEEAIPILRGFLSDGSLKVAFIALWNDATDETQREFQVSKFESLYLSSKSKIDIKDSISIDSNTAYDIFPELKSYAIKVNSINIHDYKDFETIDFSFTDEVILEKLYDLINMAFLKKIKGE